jgi:UDP-N-acetylglucosamine 2-epimerase (non-hydrolysing)
MRRLRLFFAIGTRPEAIKLAPVVRLCREQAEHFEPIVCLTGQHRELVARLAEYFDLRPDLDLELMQAGQGLPELTARCLEKTAEAIGRLEPDAVVVQGDTTTAAAAATAGFLRRLPVVHVEAGLRTGNLAGPFPEEFNRRVVSLAAALHCAPTRQAAQNLRREGIDPAAVCVTGNTVIDALLWTAERERVASRPAAPDRPSTFNLSAYARGASSNEISPLNPIVVVTAHRRESFGEPLAQVCRAVRQLAVEYPEHRFCWPVHPNPRVEGPVREALGELANVRLTPPLEYPEFVHLLDSSTLVLTDSGGVQEEAPSLGKPVLVLRDDTERPEGIEAGCATLVGTDCDRIVAAARPHLDVPVQWNGLISAANPYGDGQAGGRASSARPAGLGAVTPPTP